MNHRRSQENWLQSLTEFAFSHMHNAAGGFLHRLVRNSIKSSALFRRELEQQEEEGKSSSSPSLSLGGSSGGSHAVFTDQLLLDFYSGARQRKAADTLSSERV
ncbi:unnamed protein product [Pleuronectes platessa]|uniref:Uncharacterized protein n=1 Tax=Pleuronectes platessa TaxID=8262 RepID=A0A9N7Z2H7_PLEPL|nr:unnamed protein product [Pleuronectes platessa]